MPSTIDSTSAYSPLNLSKAGSEPMEKRSRLASAGGLPVLPFEVLREASRPEIGEHGARAVPDDDVLLGKVAMDAARSPQGLDAPEEVDH
mmetsp:Transcript_61938/g.178296  ORF Transcript_61938/g.178296 Transcript_61938/m.178296 type:complete len:90 (+) Transcript_61938:321-590(+)